MAVGVFKKMKVPHRVTTIEPAHDRGIEEGAYMVRVAQHVKAGRIVEPLLATFLSFTSEQDLEAFKMQCHKLKWPKAS